MVDIIGNRFWEILIMMSYQVEGLLNTQCVSVKSKVAWEMSTQMFSLVWKLKVVCKVLDKLCCNVLVNTDTPIIRCILQPFHCMSHSLINQVFSIESLFSSVQSAYYQLVILWMVLWCVLWYLITTRFIYSDIYVQLLFYGDISSPFLLLT